MVNYDFNTILGTLYKHFFNYKAIGYILSLTSLCLQSNAGIKMIIYCSHNHKRDSQATPRGMAKS